MLKIITKIKCFRQRRILRLRRIHLWWNLWWNLRWNLRWKIFNSKATISKSIIFNLKKEVVAYGIYC